MRRVVTAGLDPRGRVNVEDLPAPRTLPTLEEYAAAEDNGILRIEWNILARRAHLTYQQKRAFDWHHVCGLSVRATADQMECSRRAVELLLKAAYFQLARVPLHGLLTVLIEIFGLEETLAALRHERERR